MNSSPEFTPEFPRRTFLKAGALGFSALFATGLFYAANYEPTPDHEPIPSPSPEQPDQQPEHSGEFSKTPTWSQEFAEMDTTTIDESVWRYELLPEVPGYNKESQAYTDHPDNVRIEPGVGLVLEAHRDDYQYPNDPEARSFDYTSGRIDTIDSFSFEYGKVEASMKLPEGEGVWPAFWLLSANEVHTLNKDFTDEERQSKRHYLRNGEIDIMEYYGNNPNVVESTVHTYTESNAKEIFVDDATGTFHTYGVELTPDKITWTFDGEPYHTYDKPSSNPEDWPLGNNNHFFILFNLAMGGPAGAIQPGASSWRFEIENVNFYAYQGDVE